MKIGVTGTRSGMTEYQRNKVVQVLLGYAEYDGSEELHHGDCIGVDVITADLAKELGYKIICHPPVKEDLRGYFPSNEYRSPLSYFARNRNIVDECDHLLVVPFQMEWQPNGGTWYTHDYAKKKGKPITIIWPENKDES